MNNLEHRRSITTFLSEDIGFGDVTSDFLFPKNQLGKAIFLAKESFVVTGMGIVASEVFHLQNPEIKTTSLPDGTKVKPGDIVFEAEGNVRDLLKAERVALNLVQRLSGIATYTSRFVQAVHPLPVKIVDTRKTTPGLRMLEKYAVRVGGGHNHRFNLSDGILIKDNHIAACGSIGKAVQKIRVAAPHTLKIEVEAENLEQVEECVACNVDIIMLDNMDLTTMRSAVNLCRNKRNDQVVIEASGGINLKNVLDVAETGVDIISVGALTHSAPACDISMRII